MTDSERTAIRVAIQTAATELGLRVVAPFTVPGADGEHHEFIARIHDFGAPLGTLVCLPSERTRLAGAAPADFFVSALYPIYHAYDRTLWIETLEDWHWTGSGPAPVWYTGINPWEQPPTSRLAKLTNAEADEFCISAGWRPPSSRFSLLVLPLEGSQLSWGVGQHPH